MILSVWSIFIAKSFENKAAKVGYCGSVAVFNLLLATWVVKTFLWA